MPRIVCDRLGCAFQDHTENTRRLRSLRRSPRHTTRALRQSDTYDQPDTDDKQWHFQHCIDPPDTGSIEHLHKQHTCRCRKVLDLTSHPGKSGLMDKSNKSLLPAHQHMFLGHKVCKMTAHPENMYHNYTWSERRPHSHNCDQPDRTHNTPNWTTNRYH